MPDIPNIGFAINLPPENAIDYFRKKKYRFSFRWRDTWKEAHANAFTVAGAMKEDILSSIHGELVKSLEEGRTFRQFQQELEPTLKKLGWWGNVEIMDPATGELREIDVTPWRLRNIYRTNMQTAYMAGRWKQQVDMKDSRPYWMYVAVMDESTRATHAARNETVYHADDPIWDWMYPPNDWGCRCRVRALSERRMKSLGLEVQEGAKAQKFAGEGWDYNPGKAKRWDDIDPESPAAPRPLPAAKSVAGGNIIKMIKGQPDWKSLGRPDLREVPKDLLLPKPELLPRGETLQDALQIVKEALGLDDGSLEVTTPIEPISISLAYLEHYVEKRDAARERYANYILPTLTDPYEIYNTLYDDGTYRRRYIGAFEGGEGMVVIVADIAQDGSILYNAIPNSKVKKLNSIRVGALLYGK